MISNPYVSKTWVDRVSEYPTRRILTDTTTLETQQVTVTRDEGTVTEVGDAWDSTNMNAMESRINSAIGVLAGCGFVEVSGTLSIGSTSLVLSDASITTSSTIDVFVDVWGVSPENVVVATGTVTLTFETQESALGVKVRVY